MRLLQGVRQLSTTSAKQAGGEVHPGYFKLKAVQESFQVSLKIKFDNEEKFCPVKTKN